MPVAASVLCLLNWCDAANSEAQWRAATGAAMLFTSGAFSFCPFFFLRIVLCAVCTGVENVSWLRTVVSVGPARWQFVGVVKSKCGVDVCV